MSPERVSQGIDPAFIRATAHKLIAFTEDDRLEVPECLRGRAVLYPLDDGFREEQFAALSVAAGREGDNVMLLYAIERVVGDDLVRDFVVPTFDFASYRSSRQATLDHALLSPRGEWVALARHEGVGAIAGSDEFIATVAEHVSWPPLDQAVAFYADFTDPVAAPAVAEWAKRFVHDVLGPEGTAAVVRAYGP